MHTTRALVLDKWKVHSYKMILSLSPIDLISLCSERPKALIQLSFLIALKDPKIWNSPYGGCFPISCTSIFGIPPILSL